MIQGNDSKIRQLYDHLFETAAAIVKRGEEHRPILIVLNESDRLAVIEATGLSDQKESGDVQDNSGDAGYGRGRADSRRLARSA